LISFFCPGLARTKGSSRAYRRSNGSLGVKNDNPKEQGWAYALGYVARMTMRDQPPLEGPVKLTLEFRLHKPTAATKAKRELPSVKPDLDKLIRSAKDALSGIAYRDDALVTSLVAAKRYVDGTQTPGVQVSLEADGGA
jgi:Holliday junction resolvase RusA-like endonuclease